MRILIVDDEYIIRNGLKSKIERLFPEIKEIFLSEDAITALRQIAMIQPQIIITDIRMPEMNGLAFIERAKNLCPYTKFIIISGYQEFEYAKEAIKLNVEDYLIKPIENDKLIGVINRIKKQFDEENGKKQKLYELKSTMKETMRFLKSKHLTDFVTDSSQYDDNALNLMLKKIGVRFPYPFYSVISIELDPELQIPQFSNKDDLPLVKFIINNIAEEIFDGIGKAAAFDDNRNVHFTNIILNHPEYIGENRSQVIYDRSRLLLEELHQYLGVYVYIGIGSRVNGHKAVTDSYHEAHNALKMKLLHEDTKIFCHNESHKTKEPIFLKDEEVRKLLQSIKNGDIDGAKRLILQTFTKVKGEGVQYPSLVMLYMDIMLLIIKAMQELEISEELRIDEKRLTEAYVNTFSCIDDMAESFIELLDDINHWIVMNKRSDGVKTIDRLKDYMEHNYHLDIRLAKLADEYYMNSCYLSQLFKKETGKGFSDYLTKIRMDQAKRLLLTTSYRTYEISEMVGYHNTKYFLRNFKKCSGLTPSEFRSKAVNK